LSVRRENGALGALVIGLAPRIVNRAEALGT
jgi:hypothetical protein